MIDDIRLFYAFNGCMCLISKWDSISVVMHCNSVCIYSGWTLIRKNLCPLLSPVFVYVSGAPMLSIFVYAGLGTYDQPENRFVLVYTAYCLPDTVDHTIALFVKTEKTSVICRTSTESVGDVPATYSFHVAMPSPSWSPIESVSQLFVRSYEASHQSGVLFVATFMTKFASMYRVVSTTTVITLSARPEPFVSPLQEIKSEYVEAK